MRYRRIALGVGVLAVVLGLLTARYPAVFGLTVDQLFIGAIGVGALVLAARGIQLRRQTELDEAITPEPERAVETPTPGHDIEPVLKQFIDTGRTYYRRTWIREALYSIAKQVLIQYGGYSETDATTRLEEGTWTSNRLAAGFLGGESAPSTELTDWLWAVVHRESRFDRGIRETVTAIAELTELPITETLPPLDRDEGTDTNSEQSDDPTAHFSTPSLAALTDGGTEPAGMYRTTHETGHWVGVSVIALLGIGVGLLIERSTLLLAGVIGIGFAAYGRMALFTPESVPADALTVDRELSTEPIQPGEDVDVTVTVTNESERLIPDLRLVDGVPPALAVTDGSPRHGTALPAGGETKFSYTITARRGVHEFNPPLAVMRSLSTGLEAERLIETETTLTCIPTLQPTEEPLPLRQQATQYVGRVETPSGGSGLEFYSTRDYRPGDSINRIDWHRRARTGELTTIEFREERSARVVLVIDTRAPVYVSPDSEADATNAVDRAVSAAGGLFAQLSAAGDQVGIAAFGAESCWLPPGSGMEHTVRARELLATHPGLSSIPTNRRSLQVYWRDQLRKRLSMGTQLVFITPLTDKHGAYFARQLDAYGYPVTVLSPDPTADRTTGHRLARIARKLQMSSLRQAGIPVIDWDWDEPLATALARYTERRDR